MQSRGTGGGIQRKKGRRNGTERKKGEKNYDRTDK